MLGLLAAVLTDVGTQQMGKSTRIWLGGVETPASSDLARPPTRKQGLVRYRLFIGRRGGHSNSEGDKNMERWL
jgi:hypothetical protein